MHWFDEIGSTNEWIATGIRAGRRVPGDVAVTRYQSAGRGRLDRRWEAPIDSALLMSVFVRPQGALEPVSRWHRLAMVVGLAVLDACRALDPCGGAPPAGDGGLEAAMIGMVAPRRGVHSLALKWPNDVVLPAGPGPVAVDGSVSGVPIGSSDVSRPAVAAGPSGGLPAVTPPVQVPERKLAGILLEAVAPQGVVIGLGLNRVRPAEGGVPTAVWLSGLLSDSSGPGEAVDLSRPGEAVDSSGPGEAGGPGEARGFVPTAEAFAVAVLDALVPRLEQAAVDWEALHAAYEAVCSTVGQRVRVELPGGVSLHGVAVGVSDDGRLQVADAAGHVHDIAVGDVVHVRIDS